ncbi:hypothetical protein G9A89_023536 [Geosiphon pyriformis]|nr:hypothetical protein G9A89_023536 [Geosiphon pyriformis]
MRPLKKKRGGALKDGSGDKVVGAKVQNSHLWGSETGNTTESDSIDMKEECLVEETSFRQESGKESGGVDTNMTPKCPKKIVTKCTLEKPLGTIDFNMENDNDDNILDGPLSLSPPFSFKHMKLAYVRKIFSGVNGFEEASTPSKFGGIIRASFTSEKAMIAAAKMANDHDVVVNTNLKRPGNNHLNQAIVLKEILVGTSVEAVHAAVSKFEKIKTIKIQLVGLWQKAIIELEDQTQADLLASKWSILIGKNAVHVARADIDKQS